MKADIEARNTALASSLAREFEGSIRSTPDFSDAAFRLSSLRERYFQHERGEQTCVVIVNAEGKIVFCTLHDDRTGADPESLPNLRARFHEDAGSVEDTGFDGIRRLYSFASLSQAGWKVIVGVPVKEVYLPARRMAAHYALMLSVATALALALATFLARRITADISALTSGMQAIGRGNFDRTLELRGSDELRMAADTFNKMVAERREFEHRLKTSEAYLQSVLEGIGEGVVVIDRDFRIVSANRGYCDQVKKEPGEVVGKHCYEVSHLIQDPCFHVEGGCDCTVKRCFDTGEHHRAIHIHRDASGGERYVETNAYPLRNDAGEVVSAIETLVDVTDMMRLEQRLEQVKEQYRKLYDEAPVMMQSVDSSGNILICNDTMLTTLGYSLEELVGRPLTDVLAPESRDDCMAKFRHLMAHGVTEGEAVFLAKDGRRVPVLVKSKAVYDCRGTFLMSDAVLRDLSEKKALEAQLLHAQKMEAVGQLAGGVAHDFNNILTAIIGNANLLQFKMAKGDPLKAYVDQVVSSAERAAHLTQGLLAFSRKQVMHPQLVDMNKIVRAVERLLLRVIGEDIELRTDLTSRPLVIEADVGQIEQALMNLVTNGRDAMPDGGTVLIRTGVCEKEDVPEEGRRAGADLYVELNVSDTGTGMDRATRERIFEPFYTTKEVGRGTGLGLAIVYGIVQQHGGAITVESEPEAGSTFRLFFPLREGPTLTDEGVDQELAIPQGRGETILLAEDDAGARAVIRTTLTDYGYTVVEAADGEEALAVFRSDCGDVDLVLCDVLMPKINGIQAVAEMKKTSPGLKVLFISGYAPEVVLSRGGFSASDGFLMKPVSPADLLRNIRDVLDAPEGSP